MAAAAGSAEGDKVLFKSLRVMRLMMRQRGKATAALFAKDAIALYLRVAEGESRVGHPESVEAMTCLVNCVYMNPVPFATFYDPAGMRGVERVLKVFNGPASAAMLQRATRVLNLSVQNLTMLAEKGKDDKRRAELAALNKELASHTISCLAYCVRSKDPEAFPGTDRSRVDLCLEILTLQVLLATQISQDDLKRDAPPPSGETDFLTQLGVLLVELLLIPIDVKWAFEVKNKVLTVLTFMPDEYANFLSANNAFAPILEVLERQIHATLILGKRDAEVRLMPAFMVLSTAAEKSELARANIKELLFPPLGPQDEEENAGQTKKPKNKMDPENVVEGSLYSFLLKAMGTPTSSSLSRVAGEMLWNLCGQDSNEFVRRTGLGNAVGLLQLKGLIDIPNAT